MSVRINAKFVRQMLIERGMDQRMLAEKSNISEPTITRLLQGKPFTSRVLGDMAEALGCHPVDLIDANGAAPPLVDAPSVEANRS